MPFMPEQNLLADPAVRVYFSGLMIIEPAPDAKSCEVFVNSSASGHHLTIEVRRKRAGRPDELMMRHVGPLTFGETLTDDPEEPIIHGFFIQKVTNGSKSVRKFDPAIPPLEGEPDSLNLAVDMASQQFHNGNPDLGIDPLTMRPRKLLDVDPLGGRPSIFMDDGTFYTAAKTRDNITITLQKTDNPDRLLAPFASLIGANIYLNNPQESVVVKFRNQGRFEVLELTKPAADTSYEIYIVNDPLYENDSATEPKHDEFREYYKILPNVDTSKQLRLKVDIPPQSLERGTTRTPCMSVLKGI